MGTLRESIILNKGDFEGDYKYARIFIQVTLEAQDIA